MVKSENIGKSNRIHTIELKDRMYLPIYADSWLVFDVDHKFFPTNPYSFYRVIEDEGKLRWQATADPIGWHEIGADSVNWVDIEVGLFETGKI